LNAATYRDGGEVKHIPGGTLFGHGSSDWIGEECFENAEADGAPIALGALEGYPNRDSLLYEDVYNIQGAHTVVRGTIRFAGFSVAMRAFQELGMFNQEVHAGLQQGAAPVKWTTLLLTMAGQPDAPVEECEWYGARFQTEFHTRGCHWIPRMFA
jgi:hypothetical protein